MDTLSVLLKNCYGIKELNYSFTFNVDPDRPLNNAYAIYAPNGTMKTSFTRTFGDISNGNQPREERFGRTTICNIHFNGSPVTPESIYVLKSELDIKSEVPGITNILVNPTHKARYDELLIDLEKFKGKFLNSLQKASKVKKTELEQVILNDWNSNDFPACIAGIMEYNLEEDLSAYEYALIFDAKTIEIFSSQEFILKAKEFSARYDEIFEGAGSIYTKGVFNPIKAETSFETLKKQGYFRGGHRVHLRGDENSVDQQELETRQRSLLEKIDGDEMLRAIKSNLAKNAQTQALIELIENLNFSEVEYLLEKLMPENQAQFRKDLWIHYIRKNADVVPYINSYKNSIEEIKNIETMASQLAPRWTQAVELFNDRFVDMPFTLFIANHTEVALGKERAELRFIFREGDEQIEWSRAELKTLSQGEKRALYLLNLIFEVESRKLTSQSTIFIFDDIADSFDYKNKHAIIQYLKDLTKTDYFYQIVLTHNYDFFRSLANTFVHRDRCLMTSKSTDCISLSKAEGVINYFIGKWKNCIERDNAIMCATIPFTRNLIEYLKGENDPDYLKLTSLLHWKSDTDQITVGQYISIYNSLFGTTYSTNRPELMNDLLLQIADEICTLDTFDGLNLEHKVLLSIAIRMRAENFMIRRIRLAKNDPEYWCNKKDQFGKLINEYSTFGPTTLSIRILEKVSVTVSSNIHLNSFMYEPILDLSNEHLIRLYVEVKDLNEGVIS